MTTILPVPEVAHYMALIPFLWLAWLHWRGKRLDVAWWWLAGVFYVSWLADTASHFTNAHLISAVYPVSQAAIIGLVFLPRREAVTLIIALTLAGIVDVLWIGVGDFDILLRTVAWLSVVGILYRLPQLARLRTALLVAFGLGLLAWIGYVIWPGWTSYLVYQSVRLAGILLFCWAATSPLPNFRLIVSDKRLRV